MATSAVEQGAQLVAVSCGGRLAELARERGALHLPCPTASCRAPRSARSSRRCSSRCTGSGMAPGAHANLVQRAGAARAPARRVPARGRGRGQSRARARAPDRSHDPADLRRRRARRGRRVPLEVRRQRECEGARVLAPVPGARPQRDLRVGPARRRDPPAHHARRAAPRLRARAARASDSTSTREIIDECVHQVLSVEARGRGPARAAARPHVPRRLGELLPRAAERRRSRTDRRDLRAEGPHGRNA